MGVKTHHLHWAQKSDYRKIYRRNHIKGEQELYLDTAFAKHIKKIYGSDKAAAHDHVQPVEYLLFDKQGKLQSFMINCDAHTNKLFYANWNYDHLFDTFPTKTMCPVDGVLMLPDILKTVRDTSGQIQSNVTADDYVEVVIFSSFLYRLSKELIHTVKHQDKKGCHVKTLFINGDDALLWPMMETAEKRKVMWSSGVE